MTAAIRDVSTEIDALEELHIELTEQESSDRLSEDEISRLFALNKRSRDIYRDLASVVQDIKPRLEAKRANPSDPMYDYEIEARLDFALSESDPEFTEDSDNYLATRWDSIKGLDEKGGNDRFLPFISNCLNGKSRCSQFELLPGYDQLYTVLSYRDCLRIGRIFVDVQIWQQYDYPVF